MNLSSKARLLLPAALIPLLVSCSRNTLPNPNVEATLETMPEGPGDSGILEIPDYIQQAWLCSGLDATQVDDLSTDDVERWSCLVEVEYTDESIVIQSTGIPNHDFESTVGCCAIELDQRWIIPLHPKPGTTATMVPERGAIAITVTGVPIYGPEEGPGGDAVALHHGYFIEDRQGIELGVCGGHCWA